MDDQPSFFSIAEARLKRRELLGTLAALPLLTLDSRPAAARAIGRKSGFSPIPRTQADSVTVPSSYSVRTLISWGDPLFESAVGSFDPDRITRADQELRFGTNNDMLALFPARHAVPEPPDTDRAILCANNEHFEASLMYPSLPSREAFGMDQLQAMYAALGVSVVELERRGQHWWPVVNKRPGRGRNRRITPFTPVAFGGPAASHRWIRQAAAVVHAHEQPGLAGSVACGTMVNCAGGRTPWGSYLTCEEGFPYYFSMSDNNAATVQAARADPAWAADGRSYSYPLPTERLLPLAPPQFDLSINPTGPSLYGWVLEIDPYDSASIPVKRTALGRRWNEGATTAVGRDGRVAVYSGDDTPNQFVYKFVTHGRLDRRNRSANFGLLDSGTLHVARFEEDGSGRWLPLTFETVSAAVAAANHPVPFEDFGDMLMRTRESARLLGATPMDRPEDIEPMLDANWVGLGPVPDSTARQCDAQDGHAWQTLGEERSLRPISPATSYASTRTATTVARPVSAGTSLLCAATRKQSRRPGGRAQGGKFMFPPFIAACRR